MQWMNRGVSAAVVALGTAAWLSAPAPAPMASPDDWRAVAQRLSTALERGDGVLIEPGWLVDGLPLLEPVVRRAGGWLHASWPIELTVLARHRRLWFVSPVARAPVPVPEGFEVAQSVVMEGVFTLARLDRSQPSGLTVDLLDELQNATVTVLEGGASRACRWENQRHRGCGRGLEELRVDAGTVDGAPWHCLLVRGLAPGVRARVSYGHVTFSGAVRLAARFVGSGAASTAQADVGLEVDGAPVAQLAVRKSPFDSGERWVSTDARRGSVGAVAFEVTLTGGAEGELCLSLETWAQAPTSL